MSIEQHAEAAAKVYKLAEDATDELMMENDETVRLWDIAPRVISKHMQAAIDEATAPLRARIAVLEGLGAKIRKYGNFRQNAGATFHAPDTKAEWLSLAEGQISDIDAILTGGAP